MTDSADRSAEQGRVQAPLYRVRVADPDGREHYSQPMLRRFAEMLAAATREESQRYRVLGIEEVTP